VHHRAGQRAIRTRLEREMQVGFLCGGRAVGIDDDQFRAALAPGFLRQCKRDSLCCAGCGEAAEAYILAVLNEFRRFFSGKNREG